MNKKIILIGPGGHSKNIVEIIESQQDFSIIGFLGRKNEIDHSIFGYKVLGSDELLDDIRKVCDNAFISIGQIKTYSPRFEIASKLNSKKFNIPAIISNNAIVSKYAKVEKGCFINHAAILNAESSIGKHCIINTKALIEHDVIIEDYCHISTGVILNGGVKIGRGSFIGSGTIIREGIEIPPKTIIKAGSLIMGWPPKF